MTDSAWRPSTARRRPAGEPADPAGRHRHPSGQPGPGHTHEAAGAIGDLQDLADPAAAVAEAGVEVSGTPVAAASWNDANGRNLAVLSKSVEDVVVLEDGEKYILRGQTWGGPRYAAKFEPLEAPEPEPAEADWPSALWQHAMERHGLYAHD